MSTLQLEHLDEKNLVALLRNESAIPEARQEAAKILYDRGSQLIHSEEFKKFKPGVVDELISEMRVRNEGGGYQNTVLRTMSDAIVHLDERVKNSHADLSSSVAQQAEVASKNAVTASVRASEIEANASARASNIEASHEDLASRHEQLRTDVTSQMADLHSEHERALSALRQSVTAEIDELRNHAKRELSLLSAKLKTISEDSGVFERRVSMLELSMWIKFVTWLRRIFRRR